MSTYFIWIILVGLGIAILSAQLGVFLVWRKMAYFGDTLAHSALLGLALAIWLKVDVTAGIIIMCVILALGLTTVHRQHKLSNDTMLAIMAHSTLALGLLVTLSINSPDVNLLSWLIGDILTVGPKEAIWIWGAAVAVVGFLLCFWQPLLMMTVSEELAKAEGVPVGKVRTAFMVLLACVIALSMKVVGILLVVALMIIPAATARHFAKTPEQMLVNAVVIGIMAVLTGITISFHWNLPTGPAIVVSASTLFLMASIVAKAREH